MENEESEFKVLFAKYLAWKESQQGQTDGYAYEKSFVAFAQQFNKELFELSVQSKVDKAASKKKVQTSVGEILVGSHHCLAPRGKKGFRQSAYLQELGCYLGQLLPFDEGSIVMEKFKGISLTDKQIERLTHQYGQVLENLPAALPAASDQVRHYAMMDGSMIFVRQEGWKEIKLGRIFPQSACYQDKQRGCIAHSTYVAHLGDHQSFLEKFDQHVAHKQQVVALGDGARWIWDYWTTYYPQAIQILDYFHLVEKIGGWAMLVFKEEKQRKDWLMVCEELLLNNEAIEVELMVKAIDCQGDKKKKQDQLLTYLTHNKDRISYKTYLEQGLFIGSGAIESANREVVQKRMKLSGQRWTGEGAQQVANLRVTFKNNQWDKLIEQIKMAA